MKETSDVLHLNEFLEDINFQDLIKQESLVRPFEFNPTLSVIEENIPPIVIDSLIYDNKVIQVYAGQDPLERNVFVNNYHENLGIYSKFINMLRYRKALERLVENAIVY